MQSAIGGDYAANRYEYDEGFDLFEEADKAAKDFIEAHPSANRKIVSNAALEAMLYYAEHAKQIGVPAWAIARVKINAVVRAAKKIIQGEHEKVKRKRLSDEIKQQIIADKKAGMAGKEIAEKYGIDESTVNKTYAKARKLSILEQEQEQVQAPIQAEEQIQEQDNSQGGDVLIEIEVVPEEAETPSEVIEATPTKAENISKETPVITESSTNDTAETYGNTDIDFCRLLPQMEEFLKRVLGVKCIITEAATNEAKSALVSGRLNLDTVASIRIYTYNNKQASSAETEPNDV